MGTTSSLLASAFIIAAIAAGFRALQRALFDATRLPSAFYYKPSFVLAALVEAHFLEVIPNYTSGDVR